MSFFPDTDDNFKPPFRPIDPRALLRDLTNVAEAQSKTQGINRTTLFSQIEGVKPKPGKPEHITYVKTSLWIKIRILLHRIKNSFNKEKEL
jgi:hypothetical protein